MGMVIIIMKTIKKFRPIFITGIPRIERWLRIQANLGYKLVDYKFFTFHFVKCKKQTREYLIYKYPEKNDDFISEFFGIKMKYGCSKRKSELNNLTLDIIEIDPQKIDSFYQEFFKKGTIRYKKYYKKIILFNFIVSLVFLGVSVFEFIIFSFFLVSLIPLLYYLISFLIIKKQENTQTK